MSARSFLFLVVKTVALGLMLTGGVNAQTLTTIYSFSAASVQNPGGYATNSDGANPQAGLLWFQNRLFGTTRTGGASGWGTVFALNRDGTGVSVLHTFGNSIRNSSLYFTNDDGIQPYGGLIAASNRLYGTTHDGGRWGFGTVFAVNTDGTGFTNLHDFTSGDGGANPQGSLNLSYNILYGTTVGETYFGAGGSDFGTVFALHTDGTGFTNLHNFTPIGPVSGVNVDGASPTAGLVISKDVLYGTTVRGGSFSFGTVYAVHIDGTGFANLHTFTNGGNPNGGLVLSGNTLYGTSQGGGSGTGTIFALNTNGTGFVELHDFDPISGGAPGLVINNDGAVPSSTLVLCSNTLYGTAYGGGNAARGTVFAVRTDGSGFTNLHAFTALPDFFPTEVSINGDGANPGPGLVLLDGILYGTAYYGGASGYGTVFSLMLPGPPKLAMVAVGTNVVLMWPTNATDFTLESTTELASPTHWTTVSPGPVVVNGLSTVTNPISSSQQFFRLRR
jgi:uncharacterized repeat protein (TIGR03803 family)